MTQRTTITSKESEQTLQLITLVKHKLQYESLHSVLGLVIKAAAEAGYTRWTITKTLMDEITEADSLFATKVSE
jgi:hypothetical protein